MEAHLDEASRTLLIDGALRLGVDLTPRQVTEFAAYAALLRKWGRKMNLTARLETKEIVIYHFLDSLAAYRLIAGGGEGPLIDIGAGAGFPALPLKICLPPLEVSLVDGSHKKASFCREVARSLGLAEVEVVQARSEELFDRPAWAGRFQWAVARALAPAPKSARLCLPFLKPDGTLILYMGKAGEGEIRPLREEAGLLGAAVEVHEAQIPFLEASRTLVLVKRST
jgi:16S rRNA (guanine527-N7)-methyltransferase